MFGLINGEPVGIRSVSKKFDSLEDFYRYYGKSISWKPDKHEYIMELVSWAKDNNLLVTTLANFVIDHKWEELEALRNGEESVLSMVREYDDRRKIIVDGFNKMGLTCFNPMGAFYIFPCIKSTGMTSQEFCEKLLESQKVAVVPGTAFGDCGEGFIRVSYAYSIQEINVAMERIKAFVESLKK